MAEQNIHPYRQNYSAPTDIDKVNESVDQSRKETRKRVNEAIERQKIKREMDALEDY